MTNFVTPTVLFTEIRRGGMLITTECGFRSGGKY